MKNYIIFFLFFVTNNIFSQTNYYELLGYENYYEIVDYLEDSNNFYLLLRTSDTAYRPADSNSKLIVKKYNKLTWEYLDSIQVANHKLSDSSIILYAKFTHNDNQIHIVYLSYEKNIGTNMWTRMLNTSSWTISEPKSFFTSNYRKVFLQDFKTNNNDFKALAGQMIYFPPAKMEGIFIIIDSNNNLVVSDTFGDIFSSYVSDYGEVNQINVDDENNFHIFSRYINYPSLHNSYGNVLVYNQLGSKIDSVANNNNDVTIDSVNVKCALLALVGCVGYDNAYVFMGYNPSGFNSNDIKSYGVRLNKNKIFDKSVFYYAVDSNDLGHSRDMSNANVLFNKFDKHYYSVNTTHRKNPSFGINTSCEDLLGNPLSYGYVQVNCFDTNLVKKWTKYIRYNISDIGCNYINITSIPYNRKGIIFSLSGNTIFEYPFPSINYRSRLFYITDTTETDITLVGDDTATSIDSEYYNNQVSIYPNPAHNVIYIESKEYPIQEVTLYDLSSKAIFTKSYNHYNIKVPIEDISSGMYFLKCIINDKVLIKKIIIR